MKCDEEKHQKVYKETQTGLLYLYFLHQLNPSIFGSSLMQQDIFKIISMINEDNFGVILSILQHVNYFLFDFVARKLFY